jgi:hypothetical protein
MSKGTWDIGVMKVITREKPSHGKEMQKQWSGKFIRCPALQLLGVPVETKEHVDTVYQIYLVLNHSTISSSSSSIGTTAHYGLWPVEQSASIFPYLTIYITLFLTKFNLLI